MIFHCCYSPGVPGPCSSVVRANNWWVLRSGITQGQSCLQVWAASLEPRYPGWGRYSGLMIVRETKMEEVLFRLQKQKSRPLTCFWPAHTLPGFRACLQAQQVKWYFRYHKKENGTWNSWVPGSLANPSRSKKILCLTRWNKQHCKKVKVEPDLHGKLMMISVCGLGL